jgi:ribose/xylose/arabinose/galactoside ABC-type transport system permease subunit
MVAKQVVEYAVAFRKLIWRHRHASTAGAALALYALSSMAWTEWGQYYFCVCPSPISKHLDTNAVRFWSLVFSALCAAAAGVIYVAFFRSFNPSAGALRELDGIAAVIIGGGSIFGGFGTIIGSIAGAVIRKDRD